MTTALGAYAPVSWAACTTVGSTTTCLNTNTATVGGGKGAANDNESIYIGTPSGSTTGSLVDADQNAITAQDNNYIEIGANSTVSNVAVSAAGSFNKGGNTIEFGSGNQLVIDAGASVQSNGTQASAEAINPQGTNNTITNNGSIVAKNAAAIWFDGGGPNTVVNNGTLSGKTTAISISGALTFTNTGTVTGAISASTSSSIANNGGTITGAVTAGASSTVSNSGTVTGTVTAGASSTVTNSGTVTGSVSAGATSAVTNNGKITGTLTAGSGSTVTLGAGSSTGTLNLSAGSTALSLDATATFGAASTFGGTTNHLTLTGASGSTGSWSSSLSTFSQITKTGTGLWKLVPTSAAAAGATIDVAAGTLQLGAASLASTASMTVETGAVLMGPGSDMSAIVVDNGLVDFNETAGSTYAGVVSGTGSIMKDGTGTLTLTKVNTFTGSTTVASGLLVASVANALGTTTSIDVQNGATLRTDAANAIGAATSMQVDGTFNLNNTNQAVGSLYGLSTGAITLGSASLTTQSNVDSEFDGVVTGTGTLTKSGTGTLVLAGNNTYSGVTTISAGALQIGNGGTSGSLAGDVADAGTLIFDRSDAATYAGTITGTGTLIQAGTGTTILTGSDAVTGTTQITAGTLQVGNGGTTGSISGDVVDNAALTFNRSDATTYVGTISGAGTVTQSGTGTLSLTANNTYTGLTTIAAGTLSLGTGGSSGSVAGDILNNSALVFDRNDVWTYGGHISGSGTVTQAGTGTTILTADNTNSGVTTISAGTLQLGAGGASGDVGGDIVNNATLVFNRSDAHVEANTISGSGSVVQAGSGTIALTADNTYTGTTTVMAGSTLALGNGGTTGSITSNVADSGTFVVDRSDTFAFAPTISGTGTVVQAGPGTTVFATPQAYTGATTVSAGMLEVDSTLASGTIVVASGATLAGRGSLAGDVINNGIVAPGDPAVLPSLATTPASTSALTIAGNYTGNNGQIAIRSVLNAAGDGNQTTDRLLVAGTLLGTSQLVVTPLAGSVGAQTGNHATDGISVVQAGPASASTALTLAGGYVAGGPYQYRLFAFGAGRAAPGSMDPQLVAAGLASYADYRLQTVTVLSGSDPSAPAGVPVGVGPNGEAPGSPVVVPQVPVYQALPTGAIAYGLALADEYHKRVGDLAPAGEDGIDVISPEIFTRAKDWRANIGSGVQASYDQHLWFAETGAGVVIPNLLEAGDRLHVDVVLSQGGSTSQVVVNQASTHFDATSLGLASTYRAPNGAYVDSVVEGIFYDNVTFDTQQRGRVGETVGRSVVASLQAGMPLHAEAATTFEPRASLTFQHVGFNSMVDIDQVQSDPGSSNSLVADVGVRMQHQWDVSVAGKSMAIAPFVSIDYANELLGGNRIVAGGVDFASAAAGHFMRVGGGVSLRVGASVNAYLGFEHDMSVAHSSPTGNEYVATFSMKF
ncbi:putative Type V secretory pathway, adhesin AidA [Pararobbsia alpina]|uniref:autotransporter-associated beta strand repeat-containing protein n=1 Tax=Pararobbsia alpina TaxID=621374 RepID=UPI0039A6DF29